VEHEKLRRKYGKDKGDRVGSLLGMISGWGFFIFLFGVWLSPQPRFLISSFQDLSVVIPVVNFSIPLLHLILSIPFIAIGAWFGIVGVKATGLRVAETHKPERVISDGIYSHIRHPQYFGAILAHLGITLLLSSLYSLIYTPFVILYNYLVARKEEKELVREFGKQYEDYGKRIPMFRPIIGRR
jgi:protein-S-isoprenylcysteine O-methyltransferase Ste14